MAVLCLVQFVQAAALAQTCMRRRRTPPAEQHQAATAAMMAASKQAAAATMGKSTMEMGTSVGQRRARASQSWLLKLLELRGSGSLGRSCSSAVGALGCC